MLTSSTHNTEVPISLSTRIAQTKKQILYRRSVFGAIHGDRDCGIGRSREFEGKPPSPDDAGISHIRAIARSAVRALYHLGDQPADRYVDPARELLELVGDLHAQLHEVDALQALASTSALLHRVATAAGPPTTPVGAVAAATLVALATANLLERAAVLVGGRVARDVDEASGHLFSRLALDDLAVHHSADDGLLGRIRLHPPQLVLVDDAAGVVLRIH